MTKLTTAMKETFLEGIHSIFNKSNGKDLLKLLFYGWPLILGVGVTLHFALGFDPFFDRGLILLTMIGGIILTTVCTFIWVIYWSSVFNKLRRSKW